MILHLTWHQDCHSQQQKRWHASQVLKCSVFLRPPWKMLGWIYQQGKKKKPLPKQRKWTGSYGTGGGGRHSSKKKRLDCNRKFPCTQRGTTAIPRNQTQRHSAFPLLFQLDKTVRRQLGKVLLREIITHGWLKPHRHNTSLCQSYNLTSTYTVSSWI